MKTLTQYININEAAQKKPSGIVKTNTQLRKVMNSYISGDVYDTHSSRYQQEDTYSSSNSNGFIFDKDGNIYELIATTNQGDAGRISGGSLDFKVTILNVDGEGGQISLSGYSAIFSSGSGTSIIPDIRRGYYLEDYLARNYYSIDRNSRELAEPFIKNGDKEAKSYEDHKSDHKKDKAAAFVERYIKFDRYTFKWEIDGQVKVLFVNNEDISNTLTDLATNIIQSTFNTSISNLNGFSGTLNVEKSRGSLYFDTKKKNFVLVNEHKESKGFFDVIISKYEILPDPVNMTIGNSIVMQKDKITKYVDKWLDKIWDDFRKGKRHEHASWVKQEAEKIYNDKNRYEKVYTKAECNMWAEEHWKSLVMDASDPSKSNVLTYSIDILAKYLKNIEPDVSVEMPAPDTSYNDIEDTTEIVDKMPVRGQNTVMSKGMQKEAYKKMQDWHDGKRKQNITAMSDAKLKMNYKVCVELGFENEINILKAEADRRGVVLESKMTLQDYLNL